MTTIVIRLATSANLDIYPKQTEAVFNNVTLSPLYFGLMLSLSGHHQSTGALAGVQAALDDINSRDDLLPGYSLHYTLTDSQVANSWYLYINYMSTYTKPSFINVPHLQCNRTVALNGLFVQLFHPPQEKIALIGSGCSTATKATAEIVHHYNITQVK